MHIYYDAFYGYWQIGPNVEVEGWLMCMEDPDDILPTQCNSWYDIKAYTTILLNNFEIYSDGCTEDVLRRISPSHNVIQVPLDLRVFNLRIFINPRPKKYYD